MMHRESTAASFHELYFYSSLQLHSTDTTILFANVNSISNKCAAKLPSIIRLVT